MNKENIINWINKRIEESERFLDGNNTCFTDVIRNKDTDYCCDESENNNFEAGVISVMLELKKKLKGGNN